MVVARSYTRALRLLSVAAILATLVPSVLRAADEAIDAAGCSTPGVLALDGSGRLHFTPKDRTQPLSFDAIAFIRFSTTPSEPFRVGFVRRLLLDDGQRITGRLLVAGDGISLRTFWAGRVDAPRSSAVALRQPPGRLSIFEDDFTDGARAWTVVGKPAVDADPPTAALTEPGQSLAYTLPQPLEAGRVGVNFHDLHTAGARWTAELQFQDEAEPRTLRVTLAGPGDAYEIEPPGMDGDARRLVRSPGLHRLTLRFSRDSLSVLCDDAVVWSNLHRGPGGALRRVSLNCAAGAKTEPPRGRMEFADFALVRDQDEPPRPAGDPTQQEVWLADGDQHFGDALQIDCDGVELKGCFGKRLFRWSEVRGCWFAHGAPPANAAVGSHVRLWLDSGLDPEPDVVDGVVRALDEKQLILQHASLGELRIPREKLRRLRLLGH